MDWAKAKNMGRQFLLKTTYGQIRVLDTQEDKPPVLIIPDGPNVVEHYEGFIEKGRQDFRFIIFDLPGFGFSFHQGNYDYSFVKTHQMILELLDALRIKKVHLAFPCAIGFYALYFAQKVPERLGHLFLIQTPSLGEMGKWTKRIVPSLLKTPYIGQLMMPRVENKFAKKWYDYALPRGIDRSPFQKIALQNLKDGGSFCLCSLSQGLKKELKSDLYVDRALPATLVYGNRDFTHRPTNFESIRQHHSGMDLICFENSGHFPDLEEPDQFLNILREKIHSI